MEDLQEWIDQNRMIAAGIGIFTLGVLMGTPNMTRQASHQAQIASSEWALQQSQDQADLRAQLAEMRYQNGCLVVMDATGTSPVNLVAETPVVDVTTGIALPLGTEVCDVHGNTGVIKANPDTGKPEIVDMARTPNTAIVNARAVQVLGQPSAATVVNPTPAQSNEAIQVQNQAF